MHLHSYQQRVVDEEKVVSDNIAKLTAFMNGPVFAGLPLDERDRLLRQRTYMSAYRGVLSERIAAFK